MYRFFDHCTLIGTGVLILMIVSGALAQNRPRQGIPPEPQRVRSAPAEAQFPVDPSSVRGRGAGARAGNPARQRQQQRLQQQLMNAIGVTPDQRSRMAEIRRGYEPEMLSSGRRLREARRALDAAIMTEPPDQGEIGRRTEDLVAAQSDRIRLQARMRAEVRGVLTPAQVIRFQQIERRLRRQMRMRQPASEPSDNPNDILR